MPRGRIKKSIKIGEKFNRLTVLKEVEPYIKPNGKKCRKILCLCNCGNEKEIIYYSLKNGKTKSCGCLNKEKRKIGYIKHGMIKTRFYRIWHGMKSRCKYIYKNDNNTKYYKLKGIKVCKEWLEFINFKKDMYLSYQKHCKEFGEKNTSIDRINSNLGYNKNNCSFATIKEQNNNRSNNILITYNKKTQNLIKWSKELNVNYQTLWKRINKCNWSINKAFNFNK